MTDTGDDPTLVYETILDGDGKPQTDENGNPIRRVVGTRTKERTER